MEKYEIRVSTDQINHPKIIILRANNIDNLRRRIIKDYLTRKNVVDILKIRANKKSEYLGYMMWMGDEITYEIPEGNKRIYYRLNKNGTIKRRFS